MNETKKTDKTVDKNLPPTTTATLPPPPPSSLTTTATLPPPPPQSPPSQSPLPPPPLPLSSIPEDLKKERKERKKEI